MRLKINKFVLLKFGIFFILFYLIITPYAFRFINGVFHLVSYPIITLQSKFAHPLKNYISSRSGLQEKYDNLENSYSNLLSKYIEIRSSDAFKKDVEEIVEFKNRYYTSNALLSHVMYKNINSFGHYFYLDKGERFGIKKDMVAVYKNNLIGRIVEVNKNYSKLALITDKSSSVSVFSEKGHSQGILSGSSDITMKLEHVIHLSELQEGELLISTGEGLVYPKGFALGLVSKIDSNNIYKSAEVKPLIDLSSIDYVYLISKGEY